jgi:hypothetical protein
MPNTYPKNSANVRNGRAKLGDTVKTDYSSDTAKIVGIMQSGRNEATIRLSKPLVYRVFGIASTSDSFDAHMLLKVRHS